LNSGLREASGLPVTAHIRTFNHTQGTFVNTIAPQAGLSRILQAAAALTTASLLLSFLIGSATADEQTTNSSDAADTSVVVRSGGSGRFLYGRWGAVTANVVNTSNSPAKTLVVVTPSTGGLQYGRRIELPARVMFDATWPVQVTGRKQPGPVDFQYLHFPGGEDDGVIRTRQSEKESPSFAALASESAAGLAGYIPDVRESVTNDVELKLLVQAYRFPKVGSAGLTSFLARDISHHSDCLDPLDTLVIGDPLLTNHPMACDSIRSWLQRGGRLHLPLDLIGEEVVRSLLGDSLPLTVVGETSANSVTLELNPDFPKAQYPVRSVTREYDEPTRYLRLVAGGGEVLWSIGGWPVAIRLSVGRGYVLVTAVDPRVFTVSRDNSSGGPDRAPIESSRRMLETLFDGRPEPLISREAAADHAAGLVGYSIPGQRTALALLSIFPVLLLIFGGRLLKRSSGEKLIWAVPSLAFVAAMPALAIGFKTRSVAPDTLIETRVMSAAAGSATVVSDGFASVYLPTALDLPVASAAGSILDAQAESSNLDYRRLIWDGAASSHWEHLNQPAGLKTYPLRAIREGAQPFNVTGTFDEGGFRAELQAPGFDDAADFIAVGLGPERLSLIRSGNTLRATADSLLEQGQFQASALTSEAQRQRTQLLNSLFRPSERMEMFPAQPTIMFWEASDKTLLEFSSTNVRTNQSTLVVLPVRWVPPPAGQPVTLLSPLMTMRSIETANGGYGGLYNNPRREWVPLESPSQTLLEFLLPPVCRPFQLEAAEVQFTARAGARKLTVYGGTPENLVVVKEIENALGAIRFPIPPELAAAACLEGRFYLQIEVGPLMKEYVGTDSAADGEQDDNYSINRCLLTLRGRRLETTAE
jgi:hypothetical protein